MSASLDLQDIRFGPRWLGTPAVRTVLAVLLTMGWYYCLYHLLVAGVTLVGLERSDLNDNLYLLVAQQVLQVLAALAGCLIVGAGNPRATLYGVVAGAMNGLLFLVVWSLHPGLERTIINLYSQPVLHIAFGMFGSLIGAWLWPSLPALAPIGDASYASSALESHRQRRLAGETVFAEMSWRIHWIRILVGTAVAVAGIMSADHILRFVVGQTPRSDSNPFLTQQRLFTMEMAGLALFVGAGIAGANTLNGALQGVCVGLLTAVIIIGYQLSGGEPFRFSDVPLPQQIGASLVLSLVGGWLAGAVVPPIGDHRHRFRGIHLT